MITKFAAGQTWTYKTRPEESDSRLTIVRIDDDAEYGTIVHIFISDVAIPNANAPEGKTTYIAHMPYAEESLEDCVIAMESESSELPAYEEGYKLWREAFESGDAGVFTVPVVEAISFVEQSV
jgi:hypothetical protein